MGEDGVVGSKLWKEKYDHGGDMNDCRGCQHEADKRKIQTGPFPWYSVNPHPCMTCSRFGSSEDNYTGPPTYEKSR